MGEAMNDNNEELADQILVLIDRATEAAAVNKWGVAVELMRQARALADRLERAQHEVRH